MKLTAKKRAGESKGETKQMRREGKIPAVFYSPGQTGQSIEISNEEFNAVLRSIKPNHLSTTVFELEIEGKKCKALVKEVQYDVTTYNVIHLDFIELKKDTPVRVNIPIECVGVGECVGIKLGGALRKLMRNIQVECLPESIPTQFDVDVRNLKMKQVRRLSDIVIPEGVKAITSSDTVLVMIAKR